ncbi:uncharacterized protein LOC113360823 [Papaver somniferum]|uniref:uncharacterized protein LOC113323607 n=1 Tax=Papaver somniferum TaxID=3469 RepID=UPI000E6FD421|nr:uncharacterized protein LOC113323607 [Papaver somniferum]XP_026460066.1 uncharacterized protein LOC113360823 [Papaver somniferum]
MIIIVLELSEYAPIRHTCLSKASSTVNGSTTNSRLRTATPSSWMRSKLQFLVVETSKKSYWLRLELNTMLIHCPCNDCNTEDCWLSIEQGLERWKGCIIHYI